MSKHLSRDDLFSLEQYAEARPAFREKVLAHKKNRRLDLGTNAALYFEDRLTMQYQVQEMLRWKATFMVEFPEIEERKAMLAQLVGIEDRVYVQVADFDRVYPIADEDLERDTEEKTSAVHFLRFEMPPEQVQALKNGASLIAGIDHENYRVEVSPVPDNIRESLIADFD